MFRRLCICLCLAVMLAGCGKQETISAEKLTLQLFAMDTVMDIAVYHEDESVLEDVSGLVQTLERSFSTTDPESEIYRLNQSRDAVAESYLGVLSISDEAVITSGGYERFFTGPDGEVYWHIIDPATGRPARNGLISATAVGPEGVCCDALSTSLFIMGREKAVSFWQEHRDFEMILVTDRNEVPISSGLQDRFHLTDGAPYTLQVIAHD